VLNLDYVFRRSFWDPPVSIPSLALTILGIIFIIVGSLEMLLIGVLMFIFGVLWAYLNLRVKYVISKSAVKILKGGKVVEEASISKIREARIKVKGGKPRGISDIALWSLIMVTGRGFFFPFLDIGSIEFTDPEGKTILKVKGVKIGEFLTSLKEFITPKDQT